MKKYSILFLCFLALTCAPKLKSNIAIKLEPLPKDSLIVFLDLSDNQDIVGQFIGEGIAKDNGFSVECGYYQNIDNLKEIARQSGANLLKVTKLNGPSRNSTCYRIWAKMYKVDDPKAYESKIEWSEHRRLTWVDFKAKPDTENNPNTLALTSTGFGFETGFNPFKATPIEVRNTFNTYKSWGLPEYKNEYVLRHEQIHFDITEIFTRKLRKAYDDNKLTSKDIDRARALFEATFRDYRLFQERYDTDTQKGEKKDTQEKWEAIVEIELLKYEFYKN